MRTVRKISSWIMAFVAWIFVIGGLGGCSNGFLTYDPNRAEEYTYYSHERTSLSIRHRGVSTLGPSRGEMRQFLRDRYYGDRD